MNTTEQNSAEKFFIREYVTVSEKPSIPELLQSYSDH